MGVIKSCNTCGKRGTNGQCSVVHRCLDEYDWQHWEPFPLYHSYDIKPVGSLYENGNKIADITSFSITFDNSAQSLLSEAFDLLIERGKLRDNGQERSMEAIVKAFNIIRCKDLSETDGWVFMEVLKLVRQGNSNDQCEDSFKDLITYAALAAESALKEKK